MSDFVYLLTRGDYDGLAIFGVALTHEEARAIADQRGLSVSKYPILTGETPFRQYYSATVEPGAFQMEEPGEWEPGDPTLEVEKWTDGQEGEVWGWDEDSVRQEAEKLAAEWPNA